MSEDTSPDRDEILADAQAAPPKVRLEEYRGAVETLREKGYSWREVAGFITRRGVVTDHTRVYRHFGHQKKRRRHAEEKPVEIARMTFLGEKTSKRNKTWNVMEIELPSRLGRPIAVKGFAWGTGSPRFELGVESSISYRETTLVMRTESRGFPMAYIHAEVRTDGGHWTPQEIYIVPMWEALL